MSSHIFCLIIKTMMTNKMMSIILKITNDKYKITTDIIMTVKKSLFETIVCSPLLRGVL